MPRADSSLDLLADLVASFVSISETAARRSADVAPHDTYLVENLEILGRIAAAGHESWSREVASSTSGEPSVATAAWIRAEPRLRAALVEAQSTLDDDHPDVVSAKERLAALLDARGAIREAEGLLVEALASAGRRLGDEDAGVVSRRVALGRFYRRHARPRDGAPHFREALAALEGAHETGHPHTHPVIVELSDALAESGDVEGAIAMLRDHYASAAPALGPEHPACRGTASRLSDLFDRAGEPDESAVWRERAGFWDRS